MQTDHGPAKVRLHVAQPLGAGQAIALSQEHAHYLFTVLRLQPGAKVGLFDGQNGEWLAEIMQGNKRGAEALCLHQTRPQLNPPDLWLIFAPIKKARTDFIVEKAAELGASRILPVQTDFTNSERIRQDRLQAHATEAAEQCGGTYVPPVEAMQPLSRLLDTWPAGRALIWCDEDLSGNPDARPALPPAPVALLIGPEGGFSPSERARLRGLANVTPISLGPRILRADTAAVAALTLWQAARGDWA